MIWLIFHKTYLLYSSHRSHKSHPSHKTYKGSTTPWKS